MKYIKQAFIISLITIICMYLFVIFVIYSGRPDFVNDIVELWTPVILITNVVIVAPTIVYQKLDMTMRQKFIKILTNLSLCLFLISMIFIHIPSFLHYSEGWEILAAYIFSSPFLLILGFRFVTRKQRLNSSVSDMSNIISIVFHISLIILSIFIINVALQAMG